MFELTAIAIALGLAWAFVDWRKGMLVCVVAGYVQDPLRKLTPGEPIYLTILVGIFFAATLISAAQRNAVRLRSIQEWRTSWRLPITLFSVLVIAQSIHTLVRFGNPMLAGLGLLAYLAPLPAILLAFHFGSNLRNVTRFFRTHVTLAVIAAVAVLLEFLGFDWQVLGQVGTGIVLTTSGLTLEAYSGFLRSPEIAAWHLGTAVCFLVILATISRHFSSRFWIGVLILLLVTAGVLTGRRKMIVQIVVFASAYWFLLAYYGRGAHKVAGVAVLVGVVGTGLALFLLETPRTPTSFNPYVERGMTGFGDAPERFRALGISSIRWAIRTQGVLGAGAGTGSQGAQHFGGGAALVGGAGEGGIGKIILELGIPGLVLIGWVLVALFKSTWRSATRVGRTQPGLAAMSYGLLAFQGANAVTFVVASQVFGDLFVLLILGWTFGFLLSIPRLAADARRVRPSERRGAHLRPRVAPRHLVAR